MEPKGTRPISTCLPDIRSHNIEPTPMPTVKVASSSVTDDSPPQHELAVGRELGQEQRAVQPEPRDAEDGQEDGAVLAGEGDVAPGFGQRVEIDLQFRGRGWRSGDAPAGQVAGQCHDEAANGNPRRMRHRTGQQPAGQRADQDGDEGAGLDQRIAADQLSSRRCCGRIAYLTGPNRVE
jgi:hypothetical protein